MVDLTTRLPLVLGLSVSGAQLPHFRGSVSWCEEGLLQLACYLRMLWTGRMRTA